jgi:IclR family pca regulon transcriptional regulator
MGRVLLAALPQPQARARIEASDLTPRTPFSVTEPDEILARLAEVRAAGHALIDQEVETGLRALAVPLFDVHGRVVAALNSGMAVTAEPADSLIATYLPELLRVQSGLRRVLR